MSQILYNARQTSLVIIDEFGKGTTGKDAMALLGGALIKFISNEKQCPHVLVSTHLQQIEKYLPKTPLLSYFTFDYTLDDGNIVYLFKLMNGICTSFAFDVAQAAGLDVAIVNRARDIYKAITEGTSLKPSDLNNYQPPNVEYYFNIDVPPFDD